MSALARPLLALLVMAAAAAADIDIPIRSQDKLCVEIVINGPPGRGWGWEGIAPAQDAENLVITYDYLYRGTELKHNIANYCNEVGDAQILAVEKVRVCNANPRASAPPALQGGPQLSPVFAACKFGQEHCGPLHFYIEQKCFRDAPPKEVRR